MWIGELARKLGYAGTIDRRQFAAGAALTVIAPYALSIAIRGLVLRMFDILPRTTALILALILTALICAAIIVWFWGWTVLLTRRARDVGLPAWAGVGSAVMLIAVGNKGLEDLVSPGAAAWAGFLAWIAFGVLWCVWPRRSSTVLESTDLVKASAAAP